MNGLQILGFSFAFFGLASAFLGSLHLYLTITGLLDSVLIPSLSPNDSNNYPVEFSLAGGYGLPIYTGVLLRRFYISLWLILLLNVVYWCCLIAAISYGNFAPDPSSNKDGVVFRCSENHLHEDDFHEILVSGDERLTIGKLYILDMSPMKAR
uniref:Uncharacterized protein n=1 Tax=Schistosoma haematobium TaxID=6185 RepID=A0A094ZKV1_SCHHA